MPHYWLLQIYLALLCSEVPLTATEITESCLLYWVAEDIPFAQLEAQLTEALHKEECNGPDSVFVSAGEGCLSGSYSLPHLQFIHLRNTVIPKAYQKIGVVVVVLWCPRCFRCWCWWFGFGMVAVVSVVLVLMDLVPDGRRSGGFGGRPSFAWI